MSLDRKAARARCEGFERDAQERRQREGSGNEPEPILRETHVRITLALAQIALEALDDLDDMDAMLARCRAMLVGLQWGDCCQYAATGTHEEGCELAALLRDLGSDDV